MAGRPRDQAWSRLTEHLQETSGGDLTLSYGQIEQIIGRDLPASARKHQAFWSNSSSYARAWTKAGFEVTRRGLLPEQIRFVRTRARPAASEAAPVPSPSTTTQRSPLGSPPTVPASTNVSSTAAAPSGGSVRGHLGHARFPRPSRAACVAPPIETADRGGAAVPDAALRLESTSNCPRPRRRRVVAGSRSRRRARRVREVQAAAGRSGEGSLHLAAVPRRACRRRGERWAVVHPVGTARAPRSG